MNTHFFRDPMEVLRVNTELLRVHTHFFPNHTHFFHEIRELPADFGELSARRWPLGGQPRVWGRLRAGPYWLEALFEAPAIAFTSS